MKKIYFIPILFLLCYSSWAQCPADIIISGTYTTTYLNSHTWIATSGLTTIPTGANVTLDANPLTNGYVLMDTGFETQPSSEFLAIVVTPCALLSTNQNAIDADFTVFPNPIRDLVNIKSQIAIISTEIYDATGKLIQQNQHNNENVILKIDSFANGVYLLKVTTSEAVKTIKIVKN